MEKLAKNQIREIAADVFGRYPRASSVSVTADGQAFITDDGDTAVRNHARTNRYKEQLEITAFHRSEFEEKPEEKPKNTPVKAAEATKRVKPTGRKTPPSAVRNPESAAGCPPPEQNENEQPKTEEQ